jgi:hypothetical protein
MIIMSSELLQKSTTGEYVLRKFNLDYKDMKTGFTMGFALQTFPDGKVDLNDSYNREYMKTWSVIEIGSLVKYILDNNI